MSPRFVLDASLTMAWCFEDERSDFAVAVLEALRHGEAVVPAVWGLEVANVLLVAERRGRLTQADSDAFVGLLCALPIVVAAAGSGVLPSAALALGRLHGLTSYDASYLELALRLAVPLATGDQRLRAAAAAAGVAPLEAA